MHTKRTNEIFFNFIPNAACGYHIKKVRPCYKKVVWILKLAEIGVI